MLFSCKKGHQTDCLKGTGKTISEIRNVSFFDGLSVQGNFDVELIDTNVNFIEITAGENLIEGISATIENNILIIRNENKCNFIRNNKHPFEIKVYGKLKSIWHNADGKMTNRNFFSYDSIFFHLEGSEAVFKLNNSFFFSDMYQTGNLKLSGNCDALTIDLTSFGYFYGETLNCKNATIVNKGEGDSFIRCSDTLKAIVLSVGTIYYLGNPILVDSIILGEGKIIKQ